MVHGQPLGPASFEHLGDLGEGRIMTYRLGFSLGIAILLLAAIGLGQTRPPAQRQADVAYRELETDREAKLEELLDRMKTAEAGMGGNHPRLPEVQKRIGELESELEMLRSIPNPFKRMEEQGMVPRDIVDQLSEEELRILVVRLAVDVKQLRTRVAVLERANTAR
jgi:hypothetical protein